MFHLYAIVGGKKYWLGSYANYYHAVAKLLDKKSKYPRLSIETV